MLRSLTSLPIRLLAVLAALGLITAACGADAESVEFVAQDEAGTPEYGASLDEWIAASEPTEPAALANSVDLTGFQELEWEDLVPPGFSGEEIYARYEDRLADLQDGSPEADVIYAEMQAEFDNGEVNTDLDGADIQLAGFVAPLSYDDDIITEFLLVPYFGACIHVPPPPANQTIMVTVDESAGITIEESWGPIWVAGNLSATSSQTELAVAGYSITGVSSGVYEDY